MNTSSLRAYLTLLRPANWWSAAADVVAGMFLAYATHHHAPLWHQVWIGAAASMLLYGAGVVFNDVCDAPLDRMERPERPIPSGRVRRRDAILLGLGVYCLAGLLAWHLGILVFLIAAMIAGFSLLYDAWTKPHPIWGPLVMGSCRALNLLLGLSVLGLVSPWMLGLALLPLVYIAAITHISRGEVHGSGKRPLSLAFMVCLAVAAAVLYCSWSWHTLPAASGFVGMFLAGVFPSLGRAWKNPVGRRIGMAVKFGVLGIILLDAAWVAAAGCAGWGLLLVLLWPLSLGMSKWFAVT